MKFIIVILLLAVTTTAFAGNPITMFEGMPVGVKLNPGALERAGWHFVQVLPRGNNDYRKNMGERVGEAFLIEHRIAEMSVRQFYPSAEACMHKMAQTVKNLQHMVNDRGTEQDMRTAIVWRYQNGQRIISASCEAVNRLGMTHIEGGVYFMDKQIMHPIAVDTVIR